MHNTSCSNVYIVSIYIILYTYVVHVLSIPCVYDVHAVPIDCKTETDNESPRKLQDATTQYMIRYARRTAVCSAAMITIVINYYHYIVDDKLIFDRIKPSDIITDRCLFTEPCQFYYSYTHIIYLLLQRCDSIGKHTKCKNIDVMFCRVHYKLKYCMVLYYFSVDQNLSFQF